MNRRSVWGIAALGMALAVVTAARTFAETLGTTSTEISTAGVRTQEATAGDFVADAVRAAARADAAIVPADAFSSTTIGKGSVSRAQLKDLFSDPEDDVTTLTLSGAQLKTVLRRSVSVYPKPFDGFLQVSGMTVEFQAGKPASLQVRVNGAAVDDNRRYRVATLGTLASGGLGYFKMWDQKDVDGGGPSVLDAVASYIKDHGSVAPRIEGRIIAR